ncbi:MAG: transporter substrate-binding domain-containing protein [Caldilineaceae bacterium SB0675_bin_29]|uniref:Transporter substrate-binding domain-containing protein n=1 Tax=Caldilineaceae bacterium SB0675_bin_29 TaxID=2605266 RepID=A0A6B1G6C9_9CHLR|nr:transporter substrate-binding domain-containing protein [Caldilineaceae bacterium SB0675_bin_29]
MKNATQLTLLLVLVAILLAACQAIPAAPAGANLSLADEIAARGSVRIGVRNDNPPLSFVTEDGEGVGCDVDLAHAMAAQLGLEPELIVVDGTTRISFLQEGRVDISIASMNHTRKRDNAIDFSITYFWDNQSFLIRTGEYTSIDELMGLKVAANAGSSAIPSWIAYSEAQGGPAPEIVEFSDKLAAMQALRDGAVEGYTEDNITMLALAAGDPALELLPGGHNPVQFGIGVPNNQSTWRDQINYALQELWKSGQYHQTYARWFEGPDAPIQLPLGGQMEIWPE